MAEPDWVDAAIIGAGPAGAAAAIQLKRYGIEPALFEKDSVGGLLRNANLVENYPGFPDGITGPEMVLRIARQLGQAGVEPYYEEVASLDLIEGGPDETGFLLETPRRKLYARRAVIASGTRPVSFPADLIPPAARERVFYEVYPLLDQQGREILIVGAGDAAFDYGLNLAGRGNRVTILNRGDQLSCLPLLWERSRCSPAIRYLDHTALQAVIEGPDGCFSAVLSAPEGGRLQAFDLLLFAIGRRPAQEYMTERLIQAAPTLTTSGLLHWAGDVKNDIFRQTAIAAGDGVLAAMKIYRDLDKTKDTHRSVIEQRLKETS